NQGAILGHPYFELLNAPEKKIPTDFLTELKLDAKQTNPSIPFKDPLAKQDPKFAGEWILGKHEIQRKQHEFTSQNRLDTDLYVLAVERRESIMKPVEELGQQLLILGVVSMLLVVGVGVGLWFFAIRNARKSRERVSRMFRGSTDKETVRKEVTTDG
ncbi:MAG: hypothetical protein VX438_16335, partial [Planctomycetota bacterium]|nr:hypothetical protein [Planctomycetota bacterium]